MRRGGCGWGGGPGTHEEVLVFLQAKSKVMDADAQEERYEIRTVSETAVPIPRPRSQRRSAGYTSWAVVDPHRGRLMQIVRVGAIFAGRESGGQVIAKSLVARALTLPNEESRWHQRFPAVRQGRMQRSGDRLGVISPYERLRHKERIDVPSRTLAWRWGTSPTQGECS